MIALAAHSVVVLEDCDEDFDTAEEAARAVGLSTRLLRAKTGEACLELLRGHDEFSPGFPSIVLLDLNTPGMDGREALVAIRADSTLGALPVVILSTSGGEPDVSYCYNHRANAFHLKPARYADHLSLVRELLSYWLTRVTLPERSRSSA
jgi:CheY-like chemotaxis protein